MIQGVILAFVLSVVHYFSGIYSEKLEKYHASILSLSAGIFVAILFLEFFPLVVNVENTFLLILSGFIIFHALEDYLYHHREKKEIRKKEISYFHALGFFIDSFLDGVLMVFIFTIQPSIALILFVPILFHKITAAMAFSHLTEKLGGKKLLEMLLASSAFLGAVVTYFLALETGLLMQVFAFLVGTLTYIIIRDMIPYGKKEKPVVFLIGVIVSALLLSVI